MRERSAACWAFALALAGNDVSVLARGDNLAAIRSNGLTLVEPDGAVHRGTRRLHASDDLADLGPQDVVFLALKAHQIAAVADRLSLLYDDGTVVVPLQNGVPWWFFQKFPGPYEGHRLQALDPDGSLERLDPRRTNRRLDRLPGGRARGARCHSSHRR